MARLSLSLWLLTTAACSTSTAFTITPHQRSALVRANPPSSFTTALSASEKSSAPTSPPPVLNGKMVLPLSVVQKGLDGHDGVGAVYALIDGDYKRGSDGWKQVVKVGTTLDLTDTLAEEEDATHVRALSFSFPQQDAMNDVAQQWRDSVQAAGGVLAKEEAEEQASAGSDVDDMLRKAQQNAMMAFDDEDDFDDDDDDIDMMMPPPPSLSNNGGVVSPFADGATTTAGKGLAFTAETVNLVLDEVRPYLISDGGNVSVDRVDVETKDVYLKLEGACGSCASSTVTMQMGIERVLKENFEDLGQVIQVEDGEEVASELTQDMVMVEVNRIGPAISAMGGQYELVNIDAELGVVELKFKGPNKLQQGLELALLDIPLCNKVQFTMFD